MTRTIRGLASTWDLDLDGDVINKGAYAKTLAEWRRTGRIIPLIDQHDYSSTMKVVGKLVSAKETDVGLECEFELLENDPDATALLERVSGKFVNSFSIGYQVVDSDIPTEELQALGVRRVIWELKLLEVSVVIFPANPFALITGATAKRHELTREEQKLLGRITGLKIRQHVRIPERIRADDGGLGGRLSHRIDRVQARRLASRIDQLKARSST